MPHPWSHLHGIDTDGESIFTDLQRLLRGELSSDESSELLCDLVRDGTPSTAGYAALPILLSDHPHLSPSLTLDLLHSASLILGLASSPGAPEIPPEYAIHFTPSIRQQTLQKLLRSASEQVLTQPDLICITAAALLLSGHREAYDHLVQYL